MSERLTVETSVPVVVLAPGYVGHGIARTLGRLGVGVYGVHADRRSPAARSRYWRENFFYRVDEANPSRTVEWLLGLGRRIGSRPLLIATDDPTCMLVADYADALAEAFRFPTQPRGLARSLSSKEQMYFLCRRHAIPTPETTFPKSRADILAFIQRARFPVMLKPIENRAVNRQPGMRMVRVDDGESLLRRYETMETGNAPNLMLQTYIPGGPENVWMFNGYFDEDSRCLFGMTGRKLRQYPAYTGVTSLGVCISNETVERQTLDLMRAVRYRGVLDIGFKYNVATGEYELLDVNPRVGSTFRLFVDSVGMDVVRALYLDLTGQTVYTGTSREGRKWVVENFDPVSSVRYMRDGRLTTREWFRSLKGIEEASWFAADDVAPFAAMIWWSVTNGIGRHIRQRR